LAVKIDKTSLVLVIVACGEPSDGSPFEAASAPITMTSPATGSADDTGASSTTDATTSNEVTTGTPGSSSSTTGDVTGSDDAPKLDVGVMASTGELAPCLKVDVILAVDASSSMDGVIQDLQDSFNGWVGSLLANVGEGGIEDFQLAVIDGCDLSPFFHDTNDNSGACNFSTTWCRRRRASAPSSRASATRRCRTTEPPPICARATRTTRAPRTRPRKR
jgi:hypothetical protein